MADKRLQSIVLAIDSAGSACSAVVAAGETVLATEHITSLHGQAEALMPMVDAVMRKARLPPAAIELVAATVGPGSFTGIRVGLAAARGIALAERAPLIGVTCFEAVAALSGEPDRIHPHFLLVALESRREDLFVQLFDRLRNPVGEPAAVPPDALGEVVNAAIGAVPLLIAGDAACRAAPVLSEHPDTSLLEEPAPVATGVLRATLRRLQLGGDGGVARPLYLRSPGISLSGGRRAPALSTE
jgi:tRNA threonylcarbamoyladenosine biosynthesis protein TsaB